ncbi:hypothetical protein Syun_003774 [Stephania yunnanensis]|uniref:Uncharacterized protein n=1 Tax=Stephania yunnanensis TaxID=152371 RepID=A0AAP0L3D0_9MAGN
MLKDSQSTHNNMYCINKAIYSFYLGLKDQKPKNHHYIRPTIFQLVPKLL